MLLQHSCSSMGIQQTPAFVPHLGNVLEDVLLF
uniref:Uncharacterized protein n=1 Tax=Anguilla anguilla TaxID=7936 RepID=A0A0E9RRL8_ANGAN